MNFDDYNGIRRPGAQPTRDVFGYGRDQPASLAPSFMGIALPSVPPATVEQLAQWERIWSALPTNLPDYDFWWYTQDGNLVHDLRHKGVDGRAEYAPEAITPSILARAGKVSVDLRWGGPGAQEGASGGDVGQLSEEALGDAVVSGEAPLAEMVEHECAFPPRDPLAKSGVECCECGMGRAWLATKLECVAPGYSAKVTW